MERRAVNNHILLSVAHSPTWPSTNDVPGFHVSGFHVVRSYTRRANNRAPVSRCPRCRCWPASGTLQVRRPLHAALRTPHYTYAWRLTPFHPTHRKINQLPSAPCSVTACSGSTRVLGGASSSQEQIQRALRRSALLSRRNIPHTEVAA